MVRRREAEGRMTNSANSTAFDVLHDRLVGQLDSLVPFLALAHNEVFNVLSAEYAVWYTDDRRTTLPDNYRAYQHQVAHAAFLLGYSYVEAFVTDLIWEVYAIRRDLLPAEKSLRFGDVIPLADFENVIRRMIDNTVGDMNSLEKKLHHLETRLALKVPHADQMLEAHVARNALVHNAGRVNRTQSVGIRWQAGDPVLLSVEDVHRFGIMAREYVEQLCKKAKSLCAGK
jgi:hypothetical protein